MTINYLILLILVGLAAGFMAGLLGIGGGIVVIPALVYLMGFSQQMAQGTSLAMMIPPIGIFAAINYYKQGYINIKYALILAVVFTIGGYFGSKVSVSIDEVLMKRIFAAFLIAFAVKMLWEK